MELEAEFTKIEWQGIEVTVSIVTGWPVDYYCHIEIYCDERLPITETGYKSHFTPMKRLEPYSGHIDFVTKWLEEAAQSKDWKQCLKEAKQGELFDF